MDYGVYGRGPTMKRSQIKSHRFTKLLQLPVICIACLVILVGFFLRAPARLDTGGYSRASLSFLTLLPVAQFIAVLYRDFSLKSVKIELRNVTKLFKDVEALYEKIRSRVHPLFTPKLGSNPCSDDSNWALDCDLR